MSTTKDSNSDSHSATAPTPPSAVEARCFYYGLYSKPRLIARSSTYAWVEPRGPEAYLTPKELRPLGFIHPLGKLWERTIGPEMVAYLDAMEVKCSSLDPVRIGFIGDSSPPAIIWIGVLPGTLTAEAGVKVAVHCKGILAANGIDDVHVELRESEVFRTAKLYKPLPTSSPTVHVVEPFSTAVGLPISTEARPTVGGTGGIFIFDPHYPGKLFLVTARHVVTCDSDDELVEYTNTTQPRRKVLLFSESAIEKHLKAIESEIRGKGFIVDYLERRLLAAAKLKPEDAELERKSVESELGKEKKAIPVLKKFLPDATRDWKERKNRVIGHVSLSPPIGLNVGDDGFTEDWAVIEIDPSKIDSTNFIGNVVDLGIKVPVYDFTRWMWPHHANPPSFDYPFDYPWDRLLKFSGFIPDDEMWKPNPNIRDNENDPVIMVIKRGHASGLTVGRLNTIRSFTRYYFEGNPSTMSKEVTVLPRNSESGPFSEPGDSGSSVVDGKGRIAGLLTGGSGVADASDCTYLTSINFIRERMAMHGLKANFFPSFAA